MTKVQKWFFGLFLLSTIGATAIETPKELPKVMLTTIPYVERLLSDNKDDSAKDK